jgi:hypothetical protein
MSGKTESASDEDDAAFAAWERSAVRTLRDVLRREHDELLKGRPRDEALEKWGAAIEADILDDLGKLRDAGGKHGGGESR